MRAGSDEWSKAFMGPNPADFLQRDLVFLENHAVQADPFSPFSRFPRFPTRFPIRFPKDEQAESFYPHHGFVPFGDTQRTLILPLPKRT